MATQNTLGWVGTISIGRTVRVVFRGVERERAWKSMLAFMQRCEADRCLVAMTRADMFCAKPGDLSGFTGDHNAPDLNSAAIAEAASRNIL